jgi:hypothetical protein
MLRKLLKERNYSREKIIWGNTVFKNNFDIEWSPEIYSFTMTFNECCDRS